MQYRSIGKSGVQVSEIGLGCNNFGWRLDRERSRAVIDKAIDAGITLYDTADVYGQGGSETIMGEILGERRKQIVLATKFGLPMDKEGLKKGASRRYIMSAVEDSLRRLQTDWIDIYQLHRPDGVTPMEETLRALDDLITQGKVRYAGCSNVPAWQVADAAWIAKTRGFAGFISCQDEYSLIVRGIEADLIPATEAYGLGVLPYFPLASGLLTGKYRKDAPLPEGARLTNLKGQPFFEKYVTGKNLDIASKLEEFAASRGHSLLDLAFAWLLAQKCVSSVIAGATTAEQVEANVATAGWVLTAEELAEIDKVAPR
jgi:aryl-alcohol dehydrogenase-like predicted oxidoreductase